ncbi:MAG TPA: ATP-binding protein [Dehalococcoidia bacterium]
MDWEWSIWVIVELADVVGLTALTFLSRNTLPTRVKNLGLALFALGTTYILLNAMEVGTGSPIPKFLFYQSQVLLLTVTVAIWLAFILRYMHERYRFTPLTIFLISLLPAVLVLLIATNGVHRLLWAGSILPSENPYLFIYGAKPLFWFLMTCNGLIFVYGVILLGRRMRLMEEPIRGDAFTIMFGAVVVMITAVIEAARVDRYTPYPISALTVGFTIAFIMISEGFRHLRPVHLRPMAEQAAIEALSDAFIALDKENRILYINKAAQELTGHSPVEAYRQPLQKLLPAWPANILDIFEQPSSLTKEISVDYKGQHSCYEIGISPIKDSADNLMGKVLVVHDITSRVKAEDERHEIERKAQLASRLSTVGQMAAGICHEINNPLTTVIGYSDLLLSKDLPEDAKLQMGYIREAGRRVADIVKQLLAFARTMRPTRTMVDINYVVSGAIRLREYQLRVANIKVVTELAPELPYTLADPGQLQQVFLNIILNAETEMKAAHDQGTLVVRTEYVDDTIKILFSDDGPGISEENLSKIFDPFFTTRRIGEGTGLGLSVCHGIITEHNGRIYARSNQDKGATFIIELPVTEETPADETKEGVDAEIQVSSCSGNILIVDDDILLLKFLEELLTAKGHTVDGVDNAEAARAAFKKKQYDLILMDILMPDETGIDLYRKFRRIDKSVVDRVLIMTGDILGKSTRAFLQRTGVPYVEKPFDSDVLVKMIDGILSRNRQPAK